METHGLIGRNARRFLVNLDKRTVVFDVRVGADDVDVLVARIPIGLNVATVSENPNQIIELPFFRIAIVH